MTPCRVLLCQTVVWCFIFTVCFYEESFDIKSGLWKYEVLTEPRKLTAAETEIHRAVNITETSLSRSHRHREVILVVCSVSVRSSRAKNVVLTVVQHSSLWPTKLSRAFLPSLPLKQRLNCIWLERQHLEHSVWPDWSPRCSYSAHLGGGCCLHSRAAFLVF